MRWWGTPWRDLMLLGGVAVVAWVARVFGWLDGVPWGVLAVMTGLALSLGLARFYVVRKGLDHAWELRPDRWERAGQRAIIACIATAFPCLLVAFLRLDPAPD